MKNLIQIVVAFGMGSIAFAHERMKEPALTVWENTYLNCASINALGDIICEWGAHEHLISETDVQFIFVPAGKKACSFQVGKEKEIPIKDHDPDVWLKTSSTLIAGNKETLPMQVIYVGDVYGEETFSSAEVAGLSLNFGEGGLNLSPNAFNYPFQVKICTGINDLQKSINAKR